jgi:hypothetical protein
VTAGIVVEIRKHVQPLARAIARRKVSKRSMLIGQCGGS